MSRPLHVGIDLTALLPVATGVDNYLESLLAALAAEDRRNRYTVWVNLEDRRRLQHTVPVSFRLSACCLRPRPVRLWFQQVVLPASAFAAGIDVVHSPSFLMPLVRGRQRHLLTVYDMTFFSHAECHPALRRSALYRWALLTSLRRADLVNVPSRATRDRVLEFVPDLDPDRLRVISPGIDPRFYPREPAEIEAVRARYGLDGPYILYLGTLEPRKNLPRLVEAFGRLASRSVDAGTLVLAGRLGWGEGPLLAAIEASGVADRIRQLGYVDGDDLPALLSGSELFAYPSLEEGFGFPPLEAMACGVPTIAGDSSSMAENLAGAAELVPPTDVGALTSAMERLLADPRLREERRSLGLARAATYRWRQTAAATVACYRELGSALGARSRERRMVAGRRTG